MQSSKAAFSALRTFVPKLASARPLASERWVAQAAATKPAATTATVETMVKKDLVKAVAADINLHEKDVQAVLDSVLKQLTLAVSDGKRVQLTGFGTFKRSERKARVGRNPQTGAALDINATAVPSFTAGKTFKDAIKDKYTP